MFKLIAGSLLLAALAFSAARPAYVITGQVLDEKGAAACNVRVCAIAEGFDPKKPNVPVPCALSDPRGQFAVHVNAPGKYTLYYSSDGSGYYSPYLPFFRSPSSPAPEVFVGESGAAAPVTVTMMPRNGLLAGTGVDDETGLPIDHLEFTLCHADAPAVCWATSAKNAEGKFKVPAAHVPFTLRVRAEGYEDWLGAGGAERAPLSVATETTLGLNVRMRRAATSAGRALGEAEKREGLNLPAPAQTAPADGAVFEHYPRLTKLAWAPVEGAASYSVEVDLCSGRRKNLADCSNPQPLRLPVNPPTSGVEATAYEFQFIGAQPGRWRVWAVDREGREGFKSPWRVFVYLK